MKTLNNLTPAEARDLRSSMELDFNFRVLSQRLHDCINSHHIDFKTELTFAIERWMCEIDDITEKLIKHENETNDTNCEDA